MRLIDAEALKETFDVAFFNDEDDYKKALRIIDNAPTVELTEEQAIDKLHETGWLPRHDKEMTERPKGKWIPVSERLPERNKEVIVTDIETEDTYCSWYHGNGYWECDNGVLKNRIIAWQPLPEPYKKGGAE